MVMSDEVLGKRRKALEESFFAKKNSELLRAMREQVDAEEGRAAISAASGITNEAVLNELVALKLDPQTLAALSLAPLVQVAWADGDVKAAERDAILKAAADTGISPDDDSAKLLKTWLDERPDDALFQAWKDYVGALAEKLDDTTMTALRDDVVGRAREVADAAGGFLGIGKTSNAERAVLDEMHNVFSSSNS